MKAKKKAKKKAAKPSSEALLARFIGIVGEKNALHGEDMTPFLREQRDLYQGKAAIVLKPGSAEEIAQILQLASRTKTAIVPQGGNTGLVGGQVSFDKNAIIVSTARLNKIREVDAQANTMTVESGVILQNAQEAAAKVHRLFPLSLGAEGSCTIGGNLSTNAGGINVLRYGMAKDQVLGLEAVLADGRVLSSMGGLRKDNTGYDLKQLFLGAEGTLGIVTAAVLKLHPAPREIETCLVAVPSPEAAIELLGRAKAGSGGNCVAFELTQRRLIDFVLKHIPGTSDPLERPHPWYALVEFAAGDMGGALRGMVERLLEKAFEEGLALDAAIAASDAQRKAIWKLRESMTEAQKPEGGSIKHDVSVPVSSVAAFIARATAVCEAMVPGCRVCAFGHAGDGNVHFNVSQPEGADRTAYLARMHDMNRAVHDIVAQLKGSISAEHGIGRLKRDELPRYKDPVALDLMRDLKRMLDPNGILNPGKVVPEPGAAH